MPRILYSYKLKREVPLLTDEEYEPINRALRDGHRQILVYRRKHGCSVEEAKIGARQGALELYERVTGWRLERPDMLYHVKLSAYGRPCPECGNPFRTPRAKLCAECGYELPPGETAGPAFDRST